MSAKLETAVNVMTLLTSIIVLGMIGQRTWVSSHRPSPPQLFREGERIPIFDGLDVSKVARTLVMVVRHDCRYCAESLPFYRTLSQSLSDNNPVGSQLVIVTVDDLETAKQYVRDNQLNISAIVPVPPARRSELRVPGTPTLMLVDRDGRIQRMWVGTLDPTRQKEVTAALVAQSVEPTRSEPSRYSRLR